MSPLMLATSKTYPLEVSFTFLLFLDESMIGIIEEEELEDDETDEEDDDINQN